MIVKLYIKWCGYTRYVLRTWPWNVMRRGGHWARRPSPKYPLPTSEDQPSQTSLQMWAWTFSKRFVGSWTLTHINRLSSQMLTNQFYLTGMLRLLFTFSLRTAGRTERERALFLSTIRGRRDNGVWGCLSSCTRTTWMCHLHVAPSHSGASLDWVMTGGPWSEVAGPPLS